MGSTALTPTLISQLALPQGITIVGDPFLQDGQMMVGIDDRNAQESRIVTLASLTGSSGNHFNSPAIFRSSSVAPRPVLTPGHDDELDVCSTRLDENLRQIASGDRDQAAAGKESLDYARDEARRNGTEEEFNASVETAKQQVVAEHPEEAARVEQSYQQYQEGTYEVPKTSTLPESSAPGSDSSGTGGTGTETQGIGGESGPEVVASQVPIVSVTSTDGVISSDAPFRPVVPASVGGSGMPDSNELRSEDDKFDPVVLYPASLPPVSVTIASGIPEWSGRASNSGYYSDIEFVRGLFQAGVAPWASFLLDPSTLNRPELSDLRRDLRRGVAEALWKYRSAVQSSRIQPDPSGSVTLGFRYEPNERRIVITLRPGRVDSHASADVSEVLGILDGEETSPWEKLRRFSALPMARVGIDRPTDVSDTSSPLTPVYVPLPAQFWNGGRSLAEGIVGLLTRSNTATDQGILPTENQGDLPDDQSRGRGGRQKPDDQEPYAEVDEDEIDFPDPLGVDSGPWQHSQRKNAA